MMFTDFLLIFGVLLVLYIIAKICRKSKKKQKIYYVQEEPRVKERVVYVEKEPEEKKSKWEKRGIKFLILCAIVALFKLNKNTED